MRKVVIIALLINLFTSCTKDDDNITQLTLHDFQSFSYEDMNYEAIVEFFGEPDNNVGQGVHIYVYVLNDLTEIWIGYTNLIIYVRHMDQDQNLIKSLY